MSDTEDRYGTNTADRTAARDALFPELEDGPDTYLARLEFSDEAWGQIVRVADAIAAARREGYKAGYIDADNGKDTAFEWDDSVST